MTDNFELYESVRIKGTDITGVIVAEDTDGGTKPPLYFIEKDEKYKTGVPDQDCIWYAASEIEYL